MFGNLGDDQLLSVIVVHEKQLEAAGRQLETLVGAAKYDGLLYSEKQFKARQPTITTTQPIIFVGRPRAASQLESIAPIRFDEFGVMCRILGKRAMIAATWPKDMSFRDGRPLGKLGVRWRTAYGKPVPGPRMMTSTVWRV